MRLYNRPTWSLPLINLRFKCQNDNLISEQRVQSATQNHGYILKDGEKCDDADKNKYSIKHVVRDENVQVDDVSKFNSFEVQEYVVGNVYCQMLIRI